LETTQGIHRTALLRMPRLLRGWISVVLAARIGFGLLILVDLLVPPKPASAQGQINSLLQQARTEEEAGDYTAAERSYRQALELAPDDPKLFKRLGIVQQTELKFDDSIQSFHRVLARDPKYEEVNFFLGVSYFGKNAFADAIQSFERELANPKPHPRCRYYLALALQSEGRIEEAISQLNRAVADNPRDGDSLYELARIHKNASLQAIDRLKALDSSSFQVHAFMAEVYADQQRYAEAIKEYQAALAKRPDAPGIHYAIGIAYWAQNQFEAAEKEFTNALKENPNDSLTSLYLGDIAVHGRRFEEALKFLQVAEKGQPAMAQVHLLLGKCHQGQNHYEKAKAEFLAAIEADPTAAQPHYLLAQVYRKLNQPEASARELARFEELSNENGKVR
jgi:tetratricopeptide (TPR) repeat protein